MRDYGLLNWYWLRTYRMLICSSIGTGRNQPPRLTFPESGIRTGLPAIRSIFLTPFLLFMIGEWWPLSWRVDLADVLWRLAVAIPLPIGSFWIDR